jgi:hypothetical protein
VNHLGYLLAMLFLAHSAFAQAPVEIVRVEPHSHARCALASIATNDPDPWGSCLVVWYKNTSSQRITGIRFEVNFVSALKEVDSTVYSYESTMTIKPTKVGMGIWHDGVFWHQYGDGMGANVRVARVMFADGTFWTPPASRDGVNQSAIPTDSIQALTAGFEIAYPTIRVSVVGRDASVRADNADDMLCRMYHVQRTALRMMGLKTVVITNGQREICSVDLQP